MLPLSAAAAPPPPPLPPSPQLEHKQPPQQPASASDRQSNRNQQQQTDSSPALMRIVVNGNPGRGSSISPCVGDSPILETSSHRISHQACSYRHAAIVVHLYRVSAGAPPPVLLRVQAHLTFICMTVIEWCESIGLARFRVFESVLMCWLALRPQHHGPGCRAAPHMQGPHRQTHTATPQGGRGRPWPHCPHATHVGFDGGALVPFAGCRAAALAWFRPPQSPALRVQSNLCMHRVSSSHCLV